MKHSFFLSTLSGYEQNVILRLMKRLSMLTLLILAPIILQAQERMTPELLWKLGRVSAAGVTEDGQHLIYSVYYPDVKKQHRCQNLL